jgi:hypothetical protein
MSRRWAALSAERRTTERPEGLRDDVFDRPQHDLTRAALAAAPIPDFASRIAADIHAAREPGGGQLLVRLDNGKAEQ